VTIEKGELATSVKEKKVKRKFIYLDHAGSDKLLHWLLLSLACWLMLARRLCVCNAGLIIDASREILTVVMTLYYENAHSSKRHSSLSRVFFFLAICFALSWPHDSLPWVLIYIYTYISEPWSPNFLGIFDNWFLYKMDLYSSQLGLTR